MTNTSKSVYSYEGEVLSEEDDEYNTDSSLADDREDCTVKEEERHHLGIVGEIMISENNFQELDEMVVF